MADITMEERVGEKVRQLRRSRRWAQEALALAMTENGVRLHQTQIGRIESGERPLTLGEAQVLARHSTRQG